MLRALNPIVVGVHEANAAFGYFNPELEQVEDLALGRRLRVLDLP
jgi:hypothetical protein